MYLPLVYSRKNYSSELTVTFIPNVFVLINWNQEIRVISPEIRLTISLTVNMNPRIHFGIHHRAKYFLFLTKFPQQ